MICCISSTTRQGRQKSPRASLAEGLRKRGQNRDLGRTEYSGNRYLRQALSLTPSLTLPSNSGHCQHRAENPRKKVCQYLEHGLFLDVHAPEKRGGFTAICRDWANAIPAREICPPFFRGFRVPAFLRSASSNTATQNEKTKEVYYHGC